MGIKILRSAQEDLAAGRRFYEGNSQGIGDYFLDSLFSDIESLLINAGVHVIHFGKYQRLCANDFFLRFIIASKTKSFTFMPF